MKKNLLAGLTILIPFAATLWILRALFHRFTTPFVALMKKELIALHMHPNMTFLTTIAHLLILLALIAITYLVGYLGSLSTASAWIDRWHNLILRIPLLRFVYDPIHKLMKLATDPKKKIFVSSKALHLADIRAYTIGLQTISEPLDHIESHLGEGVEVILLPGVPNPLIGFVLFVKKTAHQSLKITVEESVKFLVSCGLIHPKRGSRK